MAGHHFGQAFVISTSGESHGPGYTVIIDGCPPRLPLCEADIQQALNQRRPGQNRLTTQRQESDTVQILSGVFEGLTTGTPISLFIPNTDARSQDYSHLKQAYRPGHADITYQEKYGHRDHRGGGRASARETMLWVAAGAVWWQIHTRSDSVWVSSFAMMVLATATVGGLYPAMIIDGALQMGSSITNLGDGMVNTLLNWVSHGVLVGAGALLGVKIDEMIDNMSDSSEEE